MIRVRAIVGMKGLPRGATALVDPDDPYIERLIEFGYLHPTDDQPDQITADAEPGGQ